MRVSSLRDDLKRLLVISFFVPAPVHAFLLAEALTAPVVRLVETPGDCSVAILMVAASARFAPDWFHAWGGMIKSYNVGAVRQGGGWPCSIF